MENHEKYMQMAFALALEGTGQVSPNPLVGAVVVKNGKIIGKGFHQKYGKAHAEVNAIESASENVEGATLYCNLEPCCHTNKQTPPCCDFIIEKKIAKVVISNIDPNPFVSGKGVEKLKAAGIEVVTDVLADQGEKLNEIFFNYVTTKKPFVHLKFAQTLDGKIATASGDSKWISDESARALVHYMRLKYDAVLIGHSTLQKDNSKLSIRMGIDTKGKIPYRIVIGSIEKMNFSLNIFSDNHTEKTIIVTDRISLSNLSEEKIDLISKRKINVIACERKEGFFDLEEMLKKMGELKISSILVEGGSQVITSFIKNKCYNKLTSFICPKLIGKGVDVYSDDIESMENAINLGETKIRSLNNQVILEAYR